MVQSKAAATSHILRFISCEKLCDLNSKSKNYTQDSVTLKLCEPMAVLTCMKWSDTL